MMDLIDRQALIDALLRTTTYGNVHELNKYVHKCHLDVDRVGGLRDAVIAVVNAPSVQPEVLACGSGELNAQSEQRWISVKERLPEDDTVVLCSIPASDGYIERIAFGYYMRFGNLGWRMSDWLQNHGAYGAMQPEPIAWMPLPEPYQREGEQDETD